MAPGNAGSPAVLRCLEPASRWTAGEPRDRGLAIGNRWPGWQPSPPHWYWRDPQTTGDGVLAEFASVVAFGAVIGKALRPMAQGRAMIPVLVALQSVARMLDVAASLPGTKGLMLTFDDFLVGMDQFGQRIQPLMKTRSRDRTAERAIRNAPTPDAP
jgi:hypothetical protein